MRIPVLICVLGVLLPAGMASAQPSALGTSAAYLDVKLEITGTCVALTNAAIDFGNLSDLNNSVDEDTTINVTCSPGLAWTLKFGPGQNPDGDSRRMASGSDYVIPYQLSADSSMSPILGEDAWNWISGTGTGEAQVQRIYGRVPALTPLPPIGSYSDQVTMTLSF